MPCSALPRRRAACARRKARCAPCQGSGRCAGRAGTWCSRRRARRATAAGGSARSAARPARGTGAHVRSEAVTVRVPAGLADGARLRVAERGHAGAHGGATGDLYVTVQVQPHPLFRREGDDLFVRGAGGGARGGARRADRRAVARRPGAAAAFRRARRAASASGCAGAACRRRPASAATWSSRSGIVLPHVVDERRRN